MSNTTIRLPEDDSDTPDFRVAIHARTKHADLWPLAQKMGSQRKLAEALGVTPMTVGLWVTLQRFPCHHLHPDRWQPVIDTLYGLTGKTFEELWPADLRKMIGEGRASAQATRVMQYGDACYAIEQARRLGSPTPLQAIEDRETREQGEEALELLLRSLPQRHATVIRLRYGLDGNRPRTLEETAKVLNVTRECVRQMEIKAMKMIAKRLELRPELAEALGDRLRMID